MARYKCIDWLIDWLSLRNTPTLTDLLWLPRNCWLQQIGTAHRSTAELNRQGRGYLRVYGPTDHCAVFTFDWLMLVRCRPRYLAPSGTVGVILSPASTSSSQPRYQRTAPKRPDTESTTTSPAVPRYGRTPRHFDRRRLHGVSSVSSAFDIFAEASRRQSRGSPCPDRISTSCIGCRNNYISEPPSFI